MNLFRFFVVAVLLVLVSTPAFAQRGNNRDRAMARALFEEGVELGEREQWEEAVDRFRRAYELHESHGIAVNLASALIPLGELVEASEILQGLLDDSATPARVRELADELIGEEIEPNIAELTIEVEGPTEGVEVLRDGEPVPSAIIGVRVPADPGETVITAEREGEVIARRVMNIERGGHEVVTLELAVVPTPRETAERATSDAPSDDPLDDSGESTSIVQKWWFWTGLLLVAAAVTTVVLVVALSDEQPADPVQGTTDPPFLEGVVMP